MEFNKDKDGALRAKGLAEKMLLQKDFGGARMLAMKALDLYPKLDGLHQFIATIDVYISADKKVNEEVDWYRVLGVQPLADEETIRRRYRKLALTLHPDKNRSVGADGAFNLISQAWRLLSDKAKRMAFDQKYNLRGSIYHGNPSWKPSMPDSRNGLHSNVFNPVKTTFWTICSFCKTKFEYHNVFINTKLVCTLCRNPFLASETLPPPKYRNVSSTSRNSQMKQLNFNTTEVEKNCHVSGRSSMSADNSSHGSGPFFMPDGFPCVPTSASNAAEAPGVFMMSSENLKREHDDSNPVLREDAQLGKTDAVERTGSGSAFHSSHFASKCVMKGDRPRKKRLTEHKVGSDGRDMENKTASQNEGINVANEFQSGRVNAAGNYRPNGVREGSQLQIKNILVEKARMEILKKLDVWNAASTSKNLDKSRNTDKDISKKGKERGTNGVKPGAQEVADSETVAKKFFSVDPEPELPGSLSMNVPDPDFHDFDGDRIENAFGENQVWAAYDNDDGMPRFYCLVHDVISKNPLNMRISWLNAKNNDEFAPIKWISSGFLKTSGDFRIGKRVSYRTLNSFSHRVKWTKGSRGVVHIYPKKGDIWALYQNWSLDWNEFTDDEIIQKYVMVEVLEDYSEEQGVNVAPLVKVAGFKTVFRQNTDPRKVTNISKVEMFRFSYQVPSFLLTGEEGRNAPKGCLELDPAATPMELLLVLAEDLEQEIVMTPENSVEDKLTLNKSTREEGLVNSCQTTKEQGSDEGLGKKKNKPEILFVYKRRRLREKRAAEC